MNPFNRPKAEELAKLTYTTLVIPSETTNGKPGFIAMNPELRGCLGQGSTEGEAIADLGFARIDYIHSLLDDNLPVPSPQTPTTAVSQNRGESFTFHYSPYTTNS
jgi:predicted RNase H-like HicB family nuclease